MGRGRLRSGRVGRGHVGSARLGSRRVAVGGRLAEGGCLFGEGRQARPVAVHRPDRRPRRRQSECARPADAARRAGDQGRAAGEVQGHGRGRGTRRGRGCGAGCVMGANVGRRRAGSGWCRRHMVGVAEKLPGPRPPSPAPPLAQPAAPGPSPLPSLPRTTPSSLPCPQSTGSVLTPVDGRRPAPVRRAASIRWPAPDLMRKLRLKGGRLTVQGDRYLSAGRGRRGSDGPSPRVWAGSTGFSWL